MVVPMDVLVTVVVIVRMAVPVIMVVPVAVSVLMAVPVIMVVRCAAVLMRTGALHCRLLAGLRIGHRDLTVS